MTLQHKQLGPFLWLASIQYFITQIITAVAWVTTYSWWNNTISDLGNTACGMYGPLYVCSPLHMLMNTSFVVQGITTIAGAVLIRKQFGPSKLTTAGFACMALAGVGTILVGLFPENTIAILHIVGAALPFIFGNIGIVILGSVLKKLPKWLRIWGISTGALGLVGLVLFLFHIYLGQGIGGMERIVAYPQTIWMIVLGSYLLITDPK